MVKVHFGISPSNSLCGLYLFQMKPGKDLLRVGKYKFDSVKGEYPCKLCLKRYGKMTQRSLF